MVKENKELMAEARESLSGNWGLAIGTFLVYGIIISSLQFIPVVGSVLALFIAGPMLVGVSMFSLSLSRGENARLEQIFEGFKNYGTVLGAYLLMVLFIFLWVLLLIIPGIIAAIAYSQTFYILAEDDTIGSMDALKKSKEMMDGYKWKYFCLGLRFIGWALLCILTLGIGFLWLSPYIQISNAKFYEDLKNNQAVS
jgi:uncharacterized membrane protein|tara:strand:- start:147 stop:737 length:591 start_codon:yes stop_codon:yes gene_type:complete